MLRLVTIGVWSEIATAAVSVSKHRRLQAEIVEFHATRRRQPTIATSAAAVPMNSTNEAVPPNDRYSNQLIEAATGNFPIHAARSPLMNWEWYATQGTKRCDHASTAKDDDGPAPPVRQNEASEKSRRGEKETEIMRKGGESCDRGERGDRPSRLAIFMWHALQEADASQGDEGRQQQKKRIGACLPCIPYRAR